MADIHELISTLENEAIDLLISDRELTLEEARKVKSIHQAIPLLTEAAGVMSVADTFDNFVTYKIVSDVQGKLKAGTRTACNFWNRFIAPRNPVVVRIGTFTEYSTTIAQAWTPTMNEGVVYGRVEFNTEFLSTFSPIDIAGTIVHEIGHTLGIGFERWEPLFDWSTGKFTPDAIGDLNELRRMEVELDYGDGTAFSHWDEAKFDAELMTGIKSNGEYVLPVTIDVMALLGHRIKRRLEERTNLASILELVSQIQFSRQRQAKALDLDYFKETEIFERIPHHKPDQ